MRQSAISTRSLPTEAQGSGGDPEALSGPRIPGHLLGLLDAAPVALALGTEWRTQPWAPLLGSLVVSDRDLPDVPEGTRHVSVLATSGAGAVAGISRLSSRRDVSLASLNFSLRDVDDLAGNARRVVAAVDSARAVGDLADDVDVFVELPAQELTHGWLAAADVAGEAEFGLTFRAGGAILGAPETPAPPAAALASWVEAALDRECAFRCTGDMPHAVAAADGSRHGFLNVLLATGVLWDGGSQDEAAAMLAESDAGLVADRARERAADLDRARRWVWGITTADPAVGAAELEQAGLVAR